MAAIHLLDPETINKIAAGEVVERPMNVVKELVENAMDAGATAITVEIRNGGIDLIRVTDNGCGIAPSEITKAFRRHATSKIQGSDDLARLMTLGFRGEALSSIAAVSQVEMVTKTRDALVGIRAVNDVSLMTDVDPGAREVIPLELTEIGAPDGTSVIVRNLFYNVPVRRKFLKSAQTEAGYITDIVEHMALSHPEISFHYRVNHQDKLHTTGNGDEKELIYRIYGREMSRSVIPIDVANETLHIKGYLGRPEFSRGTRNYELFFVNGRMLRSDVLSKALEEGYRTDLMQHRFPFAILHLSLPAEEIDVNVHPAKMEVRFSKAREVYDFINESVHGVLHKVELIPKATPNTRREEEAARRQEEQERQQAMAAMPHREIFEREGAPAVRSQAAGPIVPQTVESTIPQAVTQQGARESAPLYNGQPVETPAAQRPDSVTRAAMDPATSASSEHNRESYISEDFTFEDRRPEIPAASREILFDQTVATEQTAATGQATPPEQAPAAGRSAAIEHAPAVEDALAASASAVSVFTDTAAPAADADSGSNVAPEAATARPADTTIQNPDELALAASTETAQPAGEFRQQTFLAEETLSIDTGRKAPAEDLSENHIMTPENARQFRIVGQVFETYWIIEFKDQMLMIDQHAAHEKVNFERLMARLAREQAGAAPSQMLAPPIVVNLTGKEVAALEQFESTFRRMGYEIEPFGDGSYALRAVPMELYANEPDALLKEILDEILSEKVSGTPAAILYKIASMSCKAAVKGNMRLTLNEAQALIDELLSLDNPYHCPHGRPTMIVMSEAEIEKKFKRIV